MIKMLHTVVDFEAGESFVVPSCVSGINADKGKSYFARKNLLV